MGEYLFVGSWTGPTEQGGLLVGLLLAWSHGWGVRYQRNVGVILDPPASGSTDRGGS